jgi:putative transposase
VHRLERISLHGGPAPIATSGGQYWAMDLVHDQLSNGRRLRVLTAIDKWHRQCCALQPDFALTGRSVVDAMNQIARERELRYAITVDHGTASMSEVLDKCLRVHEFTTLEEVRAVLNACREDSNHRRPHGSLGHLTPSEFAKRGHE